jgi:phosphoribosylamine--glycine ligase
MRILGVGDAADLGALYLRLRDDGHEVKIHISDPMCHGTLAGLVERVDNWEAELPWIRAAGDDGLIVFENVADGRGERQDQLRRDGFNVIGSSAYGAKLEHDRSYAQRILSGLGLSVPRVWDFTSPDEACRFVTERPARYVFKANGPEDPTYVGADARGEDIKALLTLKPPRTASFILMEAIDGVEMGVGAYFNGERFLLPACLDWEHKRFFPGGLGELTGEMGTVVTYARTNRFFDLTLRKMEPLLREEGYCGYINLNTIVNEAGVWPLEFTCRFGYPGFAILDPLQRTSWGDLFRMLIRREGERFETKPGFCVGVVITTPPFPYTRANIPEPIGFPVVFDPPLTPEEERHLHYGEVGLEAGVLVTSGIYGYPMVVTGIGETIAEARDGANALARKVRVPNARYRLDIGDRLIAGDYARVEALGFLDPD